MQIIKLKVNDIVYERLINILGKFNKSEIEIIDDKSEFESNKEYLKNELSEIIKEEATFYDLEQLDEKLERIIKSQENSILL
jgi:hypothetical protein